jgi:hypothetical protein
VQRVAGGRISQIERHALLAMIEESKIDPDAIVERRH